MRLGTDGHKRGFARLNGRLDNMYHRVFCGEGRGRDRDRRARIRALCERRARPDMASPPRANLAVFLTERGILGRQLGHWLLESSCARSLRVLNCSEEDLGCSRDAESWNVPEEIEVCDGLWCW
jgi:hypothetical protein